MSKSMVVGATLAVLGLGGLAFGAWQIQDRQRGPVYAEITSVEALTRTVETPREVCEQEVVQLPPEAPAGQGSHDPHRVLGTAAGAIVGGLLGNQVGGGSGKKIATLAGVIGGGLAGREVQERVEARQHAQAAQSQPRTTTREVCRTVVDTRQQTEGYKVTWRQGETVKTSRLERPPQGDRVRLEEGQPQWHEGAAQED